MDTPDGRLKLPMDGTGGTPEGVTGRLKLDDEAMAGVQFIQIEYTGVYSCLSLHRAFVHFHGDMRVRL